MPVWLLPIFEQYVLPMILAELVKSGVLTGLQAAAITTLKDFVSWIGNLKSYHEPSDFPEQVHANGV